MIFVRILFCICIGFAGNAGAVSPKEPGYPKILKTEGKVTATSEGKTIPAKVGERIRGSLTVQTSDKSRFRLQIDEHRKIFLGPQTEIQIPGISWESGQLSEIKLIYGELRLISTAPPQVQPFPVRVTSVLFQHDWGPGDIVYRLEPPLAKATVFVMEGESVFYPLNNPEDTVNLKKSEKVTFQGRLEDSEIAYDILLQGRKIPKGVMGKAEPITAEELKIWDLGEEHRAEEALKKSKLKKKEDENKLGPGQICLHPKAKFNECAWVCVNNPKKEKKKCLLGQVGVFCERRRCLANGEWGDRQRLSADVGSLRCTHLEATVDACDY